MVFALPVTQSSFLPKTSKFWWCSSSCQNCILEMTSETWTDKDGITETQEGDPAKMMTYSSMNPTVMLHLRGALWYAVVLRKTRQQIKYATWKFIDGDKKYRKSIQRFFFYDNSGGCDVYNVGILTASKLVITVHWSQILVKILCWQHTPTNCL